MGRFLDSLRVQLVLLIIAALAAAQAISLWLFVDERSLAIRAALGFEAAARAANVARLIEEAPANQHATLLRAADSPLVRFDLEEAPSVDHDDHADDGAVERRIRELFEIEGSREIRVDLHELVGSIPPMRNLSPEMARMHMAGMRGQISAVEMQLSIALSDGRWLNVGTRFQRPPLQWPWLSTVSFGLTAALILVVVCWFLLSRLTGPLRRVSKAAESLGRGEEVAPLEARGPSEVRELTRTFNRMQDRLSRYVADRTRLLAALGHDLRSPLTAMRVRAELVEDEESRTSLIRSIEEMQDMVEATLAFARGMAISEPYEDVEMPAFLERLRQDSLGRFEIGAAAPFTIRLRPNAIRRALRNVLENAARYGNDVRVSTGTEGDLARIIVADGGPGIPEADLERVFEPFFRLERSRSRETGGTGLGLSIARTIMRAHGGDITLANRPEGGLEATITLPLEAAHQGKERKTA